MIGPTLLWPTSCELYILTEWTRDPDRRDTARVARTVRFREKRRIGLAHIRAVLNAGIAIEVVADADYGTTTALRMGLVGLGLRHADAVRGLLHAWAPGR